MGINRKIFRDVLTVSGIGMFTQVIGFFVPMLVAMYFGAKSQTDAYYLAIAVPVLFVSIIVGGSIRLVFIPVFIDEMAQNTKNSNAIVGSLVTLLFALSIVLMAVIVLLLKLQVFNFATDPEVAKWATRLTLYLMPLIPLSVLYNLFMAVYQAQQKFAKAELTNSIRFIIEIIAILFFAKHIGIYSLVAGQLVGQSLALIAIGLLVKHNLGISLLPRLGFPAGLKKMLKLSSLSFAAFAIASLVPFAARMISGMLPEGNVSIMGFAQKLALIPGLIIGGSVGTVLTSYWAKELAHKRPEAVADSFTKVLSGMFMVIVPIAAGIYILKDPIVKLLLERGEFDSNSALVTAMVFGIFAVHTIPTYLHMVIVRILHAQKAMLQLFWISAAGVSANIGGMYFIGIHLNYGLSGIAWAMVIGTIMTMLLTAGVVEYFYKIFEFKIIIAQAIKVIVAATVMIASVNFISGKWSANSMLESMALLLSSAIIGAMIYGLSLLLLRHIELISIVTLIRSRIHPSN